MVVVLVGPNTGIMMTDRHDRPADDRIKNVWSSGRLEWEQSCVDLKLAGEDVCGQKKNLMVS